MIVKPKSQQALLRVQDFEEHKAAVAQLMKIRQQLSETDKQLRDHASALAERRGRTALEEQARRALAGEAIDDTPAPAMIDPDQDRLRKRHRILAEAEKIAVREMDDLVAELSKQVCASLRPEYAAIIQDLDRAAQALMEISERERRFWAEHEQAVPLMASFLPVAAFAGVIGRADDAWSRVAWWRKEAAEAGYLEGQTEEAA